MRTVRRGRRMKRKFHSMDYSVSQERRTYENASHYSEAFSYIQQYRRQRFLCDLEIKVEDRVFPCHKLVLAAAIPYFRSMFASEMVESKMRTIEIKDIQPEAMELLLDYAYTSKVDLNADTVQPLLYAASILQIDAVCQACEGFLTQYLTISNCLTIRNFALQHNCVQLMTSVDSFTQENFQQLMTTDDFQRIDYAHIADLITSDNLNVTSEADVFRMVMSWVEKDVEGRLAHLPQLLSKVRLCQLPSTFLLEEVKTTPLIKQNANCAEIVANAMACQMVSAHLVPTGVHMSDVKNCRPRKSVAGVIFCVGGRGTTGDPFRTIEAYDWRRNKWSLVSEMGTKRRHVGVVSATGRLFAIGGHDGHDHLSSAEVFDPVANQWRMVTPMETHRRGIAVGYLCGAIYAVGGLDDSACFNTVERYDIEADKWTFVANMNVQRGGVGVGALRGSFSGHLYAVGGNDGTSSLDSCERYDPHLNKWTVVASMSNRRAGAGVVVLNGFLYGIGGFDDNSPLATCEKYDPESNSWSLIPNMSCPRGGVGVAALGGKIYAVGGHDGINYLNSVEAYDPLTNKWEPAAPISQCRAGSGVTWCDCAADILQPVSAVSSAISGI